MRRRGAGRRKEERRKEERSEEEEEERSGEGREQAGWLVTSSLSICPPPMQPRQHGREEGGVEVRREMVGGWRWREREGGREGREGGGGQRCGREN